MIQIQKYVLFMVVVFMSISYADKIKIEDLSTEAKIDSIFKMQKLILKGKNIMPLKNKKYGIELNLFRFLAFSEFQSFSGSVALFDVNRHSEIVFPIYYGTANDSKSITEFNLGMHYRYFLGNNQDGFYLSGFTRYCYLGYYKESYSKDDFGYYESTFKKEQNYRIGTGIGFGYMIFSQKGLYWGIGLIFGRYFGEDIKDCYRSNTIPFSSSQIIIEAELLKFGWAF